MLAEEADDWWVATRTELEAEGGEVTWEIFRERFLRKYFPEDVRGKKEIEFLELKQGSMTVTEYAAKFVDLSKYYAHYNDADGEFSKCIKFENGLRPEIKQAIGYQSVAEFLRKTQKRDQLISSSWLIGKARIRQTVENFMQLARVIRSIVVARGQVGETLVLPLSVIIVDKQGIVFMSVRVLK